MGAAINVICGFDDQYAPHFAMMVSSLFAGSQNPGKIKLYLISNFVSPPIRGRIEAIVDRYGVGKIYWLQPDVSQFQDAPLTQHFTRAAYARIPAFDILEADRALYLDVDLLCLADIAELHDSNLAGNIVGAVLDPGSTFGTDDHKASLELRRDALCFNSGVLVVDLVKWREEKITAACVDFVREKSSVIRWPDQDTLNVVLARRWFRLESVWNVQSHFWKADARRVGRHRPPQDRAFQRRSKTMAVWIPASIPAELFRPPRQKRLAARCEERHSEWSARSYGFF
jgi:lipopolysaccharide biosynthesis glycosyltransferase